MEIAKTYQHPEGLISSDLELKELQKSLSELDGEEDFQQVNLFPSTPSKPQEAKLQQAIPQMTTPDLRSTDKTPDFSSIDFTYNPSQKNKQKTPSQKHLTAKDSDQQPDPLTSSHTSSIDKTNSTDESGIENKSKHIHPQERPLKANISVTDNFSVSKASQEPQAQVNPEPSQEKPSDDAFRLNIFAEDITDDEVTVNVTEPEEEITRISFATTSRSQKADKTNLEVIKKDILKDTHQADIEQNKTQAITLQEDMKKLIQEEVRKIAQDQIQRTLNKELPDLAKKLIKAEISRLLSEYK